MVIIRLSAHNREDALAEASEVLRRGGLAAYPTETFYGLGARYDDEASLERLYELKRRPHDKAMPVIIGEREILDHVAMPPDEVAENIMRRLWPGPLTLLLRAREGLPEFITAGTGKVAVRMPGRSFALDLARSLRIPITATSANISGEPPADNPAGIVHYFGHDLDLLVDGGKTPGGLPSTIAEVSGGTVTIVRRGAISEDEILRAVSDSLSS